MRTRSQPLRRAPKARHRGTALALLGLTALSGLISFPFVTAASPASASSNSTSAVSAAVQSPAVEDGAYPDANRIEQERGFAVVSGNGLITLVECGADDLIQIRSTALGLICFKARTWPGASGVLTVKIPEVYQVKGDDHEVKAKLTPPDGPSKIYDIKKNEWTSVGEGANPNLPPETLVELRAKP